jgi:uncharacterized protein (TIGR00297 family)
MQGALGALFAGIVSSLAYRTRALSAGGAVAAFVVGAVVFSRGGWRAASVLFAFFLPATFLSRMGAGCKRIACGAPQAPRSAWQVLANGGVAAACALAGARSGTPLAAAFAGAFAAASADTWGTEVGTLSGTPPVSILTLRPRRAGLSGGITPLGTGATAAGSLCVACVASLAGIAPLSSVAAGGIAGATLDSILGASLQALRWCPRCERECETRRHGCGAATVLRRGISWIGNDAVNFAATLCGAVVALLAGSL